MSSDDSVPRNFADVFYDIVQLGNKIYKMNTFMDRRVNTEEFFNSVEEKC